MTETQPYGPDEARADAAVRGYHTPGSFRILLGLRRWEFEEGRREGIVPAPDRTVGTYERWSVEAAERAAAGGLADDVRRALPHSPPVGRAKAAAYLSGWREGASTDDVDSLVELEMLAPCGQYEGHPLFDVRDLDALGPAEMDRAAARTLRRRQEGRTLFAAQCCRQLGIRVSDWKHIVALGWIEPAEVRSYRSDRRPAPVYRAADLDDLLERPVDWNAVRATPKSARSLLLDVSA